MSSDLKDAVNEVYGNSWNEVLSQATAAIADQPDTESDAEVVEEVQEETPDTETVEQSEEEDHVDEQVEGSETAPSFNDDTEVEMGDDRKSVKLSELKAGYLRQSDYTKKTQELAEQRKTLEADRESLAETQKFRDHMTNNPWLWTQINDALVRFETEGVLPLEEVLQDSQYGKYINHLMHENNQLKKQLDSVSGEYEGMKLSSSVQSLKGDLKAEYGDLVTDEYMEKLQNRMKDEKLSVETIRDIAEGYLAKQALQGNKADVKAASKKAEAKAVQKLAETKKSAPKQANATGARPSEAKAPQSGSWGDYFKAKFQ